MIFLLANARHLREDNFYFGVNICKWLSRDKLNELKLVRPQCNDLNDITPVNRKGRKCHIVISDKIMKRNVNGKLEPYSDTASTSHLSYGGANKSTLRVVTSFASTASAPRSTAVSSSSTVTSATAEPLVAAIPSVTVGGRLSCGSLQSKNASGGNQVTP